MTEIHSITMYRSDDHDTSIEAAEAVGKGLRELHKRVLAAFTEHGDLTDEELEQLPEFEGFGPSTLRKRRSELYQMGRLAEAGSRTNQRGRRMKIWRLYGQPGN